LTDRPISAVKSVTSGVTVVILRAGVLQRFSSCDAKCDAGAVKGVLVAVVCRSIA
jgi:hypothetical protein